MPQGCRYGRGGAHRATPEQAVEMADVPQGSRCTERAGVTELNEMYHELGQIGRHEHVDP